ncbi:hypothetical protein JYU34_005572 [Plutella xylostella]|uniref:Uncharacterized protein n=1 Tax=Plutella xylostella TaxID=51655 RepID=A0ABQ7QTK1_PLUXY|nr:hypothetical protein JYU34_005572 [Plutella xylostella]
MSSLYKSYLSTVPKYRSSLVNYLDLPTEYYTSVTPYIYDDVTSPTLSRCSSLGCPLYSPLSDRWPSLSSSSLALSRALTDSDIDYNRYKRLRSRLYSSSWDLLHSHLDAFPSGYLASLRDYYYPDPVDYKVYDSYRRSRILEEEHLARLRRKYEEIRAYDRDDPALPALKEAIAKLDYRILNDYTYLY